jgi:hypothetical protein
MCCHLTTAEKREHYDYDRLKALCDDDLLNVLDIVRDIAQHRQWPLWRPVF